MWDTWDAQRYAQAVARTKAQLKALERYEAEQAAYKAKQEAAAARRHEELMQRWNPGAGDDPDEYWAEKRKERVDELSSSADEYLRGGSFADWYEDD